MVYFGTGTRAFDMLAAATVAMLCVRAPMPGAGRRAGCSTLPGCCQRSCSACLLGCGPEAATGPPARMDVPRRLSRLSVLAAVIVADVRQCNPEASAARCRSRRFRWSA